MANRFRIFTKKTLWIHYRNDRRWKWGVLGVAMGQTRLNGAPARRNWYIGECSRREVERALLTENSDGTFLVRDYSKKSTAEPYVLALLYQNKVYNIKIRFLERSRQYALGTGLRGDEGTVEDFGQASTLITDKMKTKGAMPQ